MLGGAGDSPLRVCIAEDNADLRELLKAMLSRLGHDVVCAVENGARLLESSSKLDLDLVILDFDMPVLDGLAAAEDLAEKRRVPVIMLSGHPEMHDIVRENEPIACFLSKPVSINDLDRAIHKTMAGIHR